MGLYTHIRETIPHQTQNGGTPMDQLEIKRMRLIELLTLNALYIFLFGLFVLTNIIWLNTNSLKHTFIVTAIILIIHSTVRLLQRDKTVSIIPIFTTVRKFERGIMGDDWDQEQKKAIVGNYFTAGLFLLQSSIVPPFQEPLTLEKEILASFFILFVILNILQFFRVRKIDNYVPKNNTTNSGNNAFILIFASIMIMYGAFAGMLLLFF